MDIVNISFWFLHRNLPDESPYILNDDEYALKYRAELKCAVLRAKSSPRALLKGYYVCIAAHVQPPAMTLSAIVRSAGGEVSLKKLTESWLYTHLIVIEALFYGR